MGLWAMTPTCPWTQAPTSGCLGLSPTETGVVSPRGPASSGPLRPSTLPCFDLQPPGPPAGAYSFGHSLCCAAFSQGTLSGLFNEDNEERLSWVGRVLDTASFHSHMLTVRVLGPVLGSGTPQDIQS